MAEEEKVEEKKSGGGGLLPLLTLVLVAVSIGVSAFSMITVMSLKSGLTEMVQQANTPEGIPGEVDVNDIDTFSFTENFIFRFKDTENPKVTNTVVMDISVGILTTEDTAEDAATLKALMTSKEGIIRDGLESMMTSENYEEFLTTEGLDGIKTKVIEYLQGRLVSDLIIDVYFTNKVTSSS